MNKTIEKSVLSGVLPAISSKSYAHRMLLCAMLTPSEVTLDGVDYSADIEATLRVAEAFGAKFEGQGGSYFFNGKRENKKTAVADCIESGSTLRFCIPLAAALGIETTFVGSERLLSRPNDALFECLKVHGATVDGYRVGGKLESGIYEIDASLSSQYVTGLMLALPLLDGDSEIILRGKTVSKAYLDITADVLKTSGIDVVREKEKYYIRGNQAYVMPRHTTVPGDWSNAAFFLTAGAIEGNSVTVTGLERDSQGDSKILDCLKKYGAKVTVNGNSVTVTSQNHNPIDVDIEETPDLAPILGVLCATANGTSVLRSVDRLKIKESDRLEAIIQNLSQAGVKSEYRENALYIHGGGELRRGKFSGYNDHRMVMSAAVMCGIAGGEICGVEAVKKSYPDFFADFAKIGGIVK